MEALNAQVNFRVCNLVMTIDNLARVVGGMPRVCQNAKIQYLGIGWCYCLDVMYENKVKSVSQSDNQANYTISHIKCFFKGG